MICDDYAREPERLKPCPFCGGQDPVLVPVGKRGNAHVVCTACGSGGPVLQAEEAAGLWNAVDKGAVAMRSDKPVILFVANDEICDDFCTTAHEVTSSHDCEVVEWRGRFYDDPGEFAEDYADFRWDEGEKDEAAVRAEARRLWDEHAVLCTVCYTGGTNGPRRCRIGEGDA